MCILFLVSGILRFFPADPFEVFLDGGFDLGFSTARVFSSSLFVDLRVLIISVGNTYSNILFLYVYLISLHFLIRSLY